MNSRMFAKGSFLPLKSARRSATVTSSAPLASRASRMVSGEENFPVPKMRRERKIRPAMINGWFDNDIRAQSNRKEGALSSGERRSWLKNIRVRRLVSAYFAEMKSMTGYGRGDCSQDGFKITVELSSVNRKQTEISVNLPREMEMLEAPIRDLINRHIARGRLTVRVSLHAAAGKASARMHINLPLAKAYALELERLAKHLKLAG